MIAGHGRVFELCDRLMHAQKELASLKTPKVLYVCVYVGVCACVCRGLTVPFCHLS